MIEPPNDKTAKNMHRAMPACPTIVRTKTAVRAGPAFAGIVPNGIEGIVPPSSARRTMVMEIDAAAIATSMKPMAAILRPGMNGPLPADRPREALPVFRGRGIVGSAPASRGGKLGGSSSRYESNAEGGGASGLRTGSALAVLGGDFSPIVFRLLGGAASSGGDGTMNNWPHALHRPFLPASARSTLKPCPQLGHWNAIVMPHLRIPVRSRRATSGDGSTQRTLSSLCRPARPGPQHQLCVPSASRTERQRACLPIQRPTAAFRIGAGLVRRDVPRLRSSLATTRPFHPSSSRIGL